MLKIYVSALYLSFFCCPYFALAQSATTTIDDFSWLTGHWTGDGFGGRMEEYWAPPSDGVMMGMFKHSKDGEITFYEFFTIVQENGQWALKLKHFTPELVGWEEKTDYVTFPLVSVAPTEIAFDGLVMRKLSTNQIEVILNIKRKGEIDTERFVYTRLGNIH